MRQHPAESGPISQSSLAGGASSGQNELSVKVNNDANTQAGIMGELDDGNSWANFRVQNTKYRAWAMIESDVRPRLDSTAIGASYAVDGEQWTVDSGRRTEYS